MATLLEQFEEEQQLAIAPTPGGFITTDKPYTSGRNVTSAATQVCVPHHYPMVPAVIPCTLDTCIIHGSLKLTSIKSGHLCITSQNTSNACSKDRMQDFNVVASVNIKK